MGRPPSLHTCTAERGHQAARARRDVAGRARGQLDPKPTFVSLPVDRWGYRGAVIRTTRLSSSRQLVEQRLRLVEIGCVKAFGEPAINGGEKVKGFGAVPLVATEPCNADGGA
jgi:hypothetical protein